MNSRYQRPLQSLSVPIVYLFFFSGEFCQIFWARACGFGRGNIICLIIQTSNTNKGAAVPGMKAFCSNLLSNILIINEGYNHYF